MEYAITTNCLTKQFKNHKAVNAINMHVKRGEIYGFIGRNGAGKTTCMKMLTGLATPTSGEITLFGHTGKDAADYYSRIGLLIENPGYYQNMTALENIKMKCIALGICQPGYAENILKEVNLDDTKSKRIKHFSLGMKQRLGIGLALVGEPDMLVLDEPINGLDPQGIVQIRETLLKLNQEKGMTILISSHILEELSKLADTYGIINDGTLIQEIPKEELLEKSKSYLKLNIDPVDKASIVLESMGLTKYKVIDKNTIHLYEHLEMAAEINKKLILGGCNINASSVVSGQLEDYYLDITGGVYHD